jgi:hypothetical protein
MSAKQCLEHRWLSGCESDKLQCEEQREQTVDVLANEDHITAIVHSEVDSTACETTNAVSSVTASTSLPRCRLSSSIDSPSGQRRALIMTLTSDDDFIINHEPTKKCRCDIDEVKPLEATTVSTTTVSIVMTSSDIHKVDGKENNRTETCVSTVTAPLLSCVETLSVCGDMNLALNPPSCVNVSVT